MKKLFIYTIIVLAMIGCGSNDTKYSVTDDGNGTHSPRIMRVALTEYSYDDNTTKEMTILYKYNKENLLIEKKELDDNSTTSYAYNSKKQVILVNHLTARAHGYEKKKFIYGDVLYEKTNQPIVISNESSHGLYNDNGRFLQGGISHINYEYEYNDSGKVTKLNSSTYAYEVGEPVIRKYIYNKNKKIIQEYHDDRITKQYTYTTSGKLSTEYTYNYQRIGSDSIIEYSYNDENLIISARTYDIENSGEKTLRETKKYIYENKPYYSNQSPSYLDQGQYSSSGIY